MYRILVFLISLLSITSVAEPVGKLRTLSNTMVGKTRVFVTAQRNDHVLGQNFQVELRYACHQSHKAAEELEVKDSFSVCDLDPKSIKLNRKKTAVALKTKMADIDGYYDEIAKGHSPEDANCMKKTAVKKFSLKNLCQLPVSRTQQPSL